MLPLREAKSQSAACQMNMNGLVQSCWKPTQAVPVATITHEEI